MLKVIQFTENLKKAKPNENINIYYGFSTSDHQISIRFPSRHVVKSDLKTDAGIWVDKAIEKLAKCSETGSKGNPQIHEKTIKIQPWLHRCTLC